MFKNWNPKHVVVWLAFLVGLAWAVVSFVGKLPAGQSTGAVAMALAPFLVMLVSKAFSFYMNPPSDPAAALAAGEAAGGLGAKRGFVRAELLVGVAILGVVLGAMTFRAAREQARFEPVAVQGEGCAWFAQNRGPVTADSAQIASCVVPLLLQGLGANAIVGQCSMATFEDVAKIAESLVAFYAAPADGGLGGATPNGAACGAGAPPYKEAPSCVPVALLSKIGEARGYALAHSTG